MKVRDLIRDLLDTDMNAEVMISAPLECSQSDPRPGHLSIPSLGIRTGTFQGPGSEPAVGSPWVMVQGTSVWGHHFSPAELERAQARTTPERTAFYAQLAGARKDVDQLQAMLSGASPPLLAFVRALADQTLCPMTGEPGLGCHACGGENNCRSDHPECMSMRAWALLNPTGHR